jgi:predicted nucleotide-binding protein
MTPQVFIASSSEGLNFATAIQDLLIQKLGQKVDVRIWKQEFKISKAFIESLEKETFDNDFAILVLTPDDITTSRKKKNQSPRDNVIFELGLFMGSLGRERCFFVHNETPDLKLPTDLLGVMGATYNYVSEESSKDISKETLAVVLNDPCSVIADRITELSTRRKLSLEKYLEQAAIHNFCRRIEGAWWSKMIKAGKNSIGFFQIDIDPLYNSVSLDGKAYTKEGVHLANWNSLFGRVDIDDNKVLYHWKGSHQLGNPNVPFHGYGEMEFNRPQKIQDMIILGESRFWDVDEFHPENTVQKLSNLRRILDEDTISTMTGGNEKKIRLLVKKTIEEW